MKKFIRIILLVIIVLFVFYLTGERVMENEPLEAPVKHGSAIPAKSKGVGSPIPQTSRPEEGISIYVGEDASVITEKYGEPNRIEPSHYEYDWWIYDEDIQLYIGVNEEGVINQVYTLDPTIRLSPFELGQELEDIYRFSIIGAEIDVALDDNIYTFSLNSEDTQTRPLIVYQDLFAQLYIDEKEGKLEGVRFIDPATLVLHQPYEMTYMGELLLSQPPSSTLQLEVNETTERQLFELVNALRENHHVKSLKRHYALDELSKAHSEILALENVSKDDEQKNEQLLQRLKSANIEHKKAGENTAFNYADAIEAVHGWMNSEKHRQLLLNDQFTHVGTGAYGNYFTQTFIQSEEVDISQTIQ